MADNSSAETDWFLWLRTFNHPVVFCLDATPDGSGLLTPTVTGGAGGYASVTLIAESTRNLDREVTQ